MSFSEIRKRFLEYFKKRGHVIVPSSSLVSDDPSVLLTTAGMQQFKSYFTGEKDAMRDFGSANVVSIQKCFRTSDIDEVGDESHLTFFEMLGNFSFGGYWKEEAIRYVHEFITKEMGLAIDYVTVFDPGKVPEGDWRKGVPRDDESRAVWEKLGVRDIRGDGTDVFWGPTGNEGPCGPTTEVYVNGLEVWNIVFNEFYADKEKKLAPLKTRGIDTGMGLERLTMVAQEKKNVFETDLFAPFMQALPGTLSISEKRIAADHVRGAAFLISDGVRPSNKGEGYVLRRLMRRLLMFEEKGVVFSVYPELREGEAVRVFEAERVEFSKTLRKGLQELGKLSRVGAEEAFNLYQSFGLPYEVIKDVGGAKAEDLERDDFDREFEKHQEISRAGAEKKFGGHGLSADAEGVAVRLHTATHLLHQALRDVLGESVRQEGSDITPERARFDFRFERKVTPDELARVEAIVNEKIRENLPVNRIEMPKDEAEKTGALHLFSAGGGSSFGGKEKYPDIVSVYYIGKSLEDAYSKEFCGGPHVARTGEIGEFKIVKEESVSAGTRRIRAVIV